MRIFQVVWCGQVLPPVARQHFIGMIPSIFMGTSPSIPRSTLLICFNQQSMSILPLLEFRVLKDVQVTLHCCYHLGLILTGTSPKFFRNLSSVMYILGYSQQNEFDVGFSVPRFKSGLPRVLGLFCILVPIVWSIKIWTQTTCIICGGGCKDL